MDGRSTKREIDWDRVPEGLKEDFETARANRDWAKMKQLQAQLEPYKVVGDAGGKRGKPPQKQEG